LRNHTIPGIGRLYSAISIFPQSALPIGHSSLANGCSHRGWSPRKLATSPISPRLSASETDDGFSTMFERERNRALFKSLMVLGPRMMNRPFYDFNLLRFGWRRLQFLYRTCTVRAGKSTNAFQIYSGVGCGALEKLSPEPQLQAPVPDPLVIRNKQKFSSSSA